MSQEQTKLERDSREVEVLAGALVGLGVVSVVQMLGVQNLDLWLKVSVYSFAVSVPALTACILCARESVIFGRRANSVLLGIFALTGALGSFVGVSALFFHFTIYAGVLFIVTSLIGFVVYHRYAEAIEKPKSN